MQAKKGLRHRVDVVREREIKSKRNYSREKQKRKVKDKRKNPFGKKLIARSRDETTWIKSRGTQEKRTWVKVVIPLTESDESRPDP